ncbi:MAG: carboxypeptidase regulatory-like domain-containing protein [Pyrinomonadaceae bacterium]
MKRLAMSLVGALFVLFACQAFVFAQTTGSITGAVVDANGAAVPNATVIVKGTGGQEFTVVTNDNGIYRVPSVASGVYSVATTAPNFKSSGVEDVKVDVGLPSTVNVTLQTGEVSETVVVTGGGEVLQTQTATVGSTITGRQIIETPVASRDALDLIGLLPGTASVGAPRRSSINGLPKGSLSITIDGVDVQDNLLRSSDGYFTYVRPRLDAIEEVTVSSSNPGSEGGGDGAVQIKFVTKRGNNGYAGSLFWQHRDESLNGNYWYQNRDGQRDQNGEAYRQKIRLNQYGGSYGGPIPFLRFGDGDNGWWDSGKDKRFFFVNYEEFRLPAAQARTRTVFTPDAQAGIYSYVVGGQTRTANLLTIAQNARNAQGVVTPQLSTPDPTITAVLGQIRSALSSEGTLTPVTNSPNYMNYNFSPAGDSTRKFLAVRLDFNLGKTNSLEFVTNQQEFVPSKDFLNSQDERFPGFPWYTQGSVRDSYSTALRSAFGKSVTNEARFAMSTGLSTFSDGISAADFDFSGGYQLGVDAAGLTTPYSRNSYSDRNTPTFDLTDNVTWIKGNHSIGFGGQWKLIRREGAGIGRIVPTVGFGIESGDSIAFNMFCATTSTQCPVATLPGASATQLTAARNHYATLIGRITGFTSTAYLSPDGTYRENSNQARLAKQNTYGLYVQDSWKLAPNFTINYGVRWQPQSAFVALSEGIYTKLENWEQVYGISGYGNVFKPGTLTGSAPRVVPLEIGEKAYEDDINNFAPSVGVVWSPNFGDSWFGKIFGSNGKSVIRGGYSQAFVREGFDLLESIYGANPGESLSLSRSTANGNLTLGTNLRDPNNPNLTPATFTNGNPIVGSTPSFPIALVTANSTNAFIPDLKTGVVHSMSFGYQREIDRNTVVEFRYVGNRGVDLQRQYNVNEFNTIENGFADEFKLAQDNLYANIAAGRGASFAYFGANTNTSPLPIMVKYFAAYNATFPNAWTIPQGTAGSPYTATNFANSTLVAALSRNAPSVFAFNGTSFENNAGRRANAMSYPGAQALPINFFYVNPHTIGGGSWLVDNSSKTWYDSGVIEVRRRMSQGLRISANYVFSKAQANAYASSSVVGATNSLRANGFDLAKNVQAFDIRHQFKFDATWDVPFGKGQPFLSNSNWFVNGIVGGWTILPTIKWQSGSPFAFGNVQLVGMTVKDLQKSIGVYKGANVVTFLPDDIILNTQKAFNIDVSNTANSGYGTTFGTGGPAGRFLAPAGYGNCISRTAGDCGFNNLIVYGPGFFKFDATVAKRFKWGERRSVEFRVTALDVLNAPNFRVGGFGADVVTAGVGGSTFGQLGNGSAYQDVSTTNDLGGRQIDLMFRFNF